MGLQERIDHGGASSTCRGWAAGIQSLSEIIPREERRDSGWLEEVGVGNCALKGGREEEVEELSTFWESGSELKACVCDRFGGLGSWVLGSVDVEEVTGRRGNIAVVSSKVLDLERRSCCRIGDFDLAVQLFNWADWVELFDIPGLFEVLPYWALPGKVGFSDLGWEPKRVMSSIR